VNAVGSEPPASPSVPPAGGALGSVPRLKLYPDVPSRRQATIVRDLVVLLALLFFAWIGFKTYSAVDALKVLGSGVTTAGTSVQSGFESVAGVVGGIPVVGDKLAGALQGAGAGTGGELADLGRQGVERIHDLAIILGLFVFCLPAFVVLLAALPRRIRQVRRLTAASVVLANPQDEDRRRLMAMRAGFGLPYGVLLKYTRDPLGDLAGGRYDALVAAALDDAGVVPRGR
jgi:hypothetical protein